MLMAHGTTCRATVCRAVPLVEYCERHRALNIIRGGGREVSEVKS